VLQLLPIIEVLASLVGTMVNVNIATPNNEHQQSICRVSTISGVPSCIIPWLCYDFFLQSMYWPPLSAIWLISLSLHQKMSVNRPSTECQQSINYVGCCISYNPRTILWYLPVINVLEAFVYKRESDMVTARV
jgi:hypothetical protein